MSLRAPLRERLTAFDSFTDNITRVHLPTNWVLKTVVTNLQVRSNVPALYDRDGVQTGNIEFYAYNHSSMADCGTVLILR